MHMLLTSFGMRPHACLMHVNIRLCCYWLCIAGTSDVYNKWSQGLHVNHLECAHMPV